MIVFAVNYKLNADDFCEVLNHHKYFSTLEKAESFMQSMIDLQPIIVYDEDGEPAYNDDMHCLEVCQDGSVSIYISQLQIDQE